MDRRPSRLSLSLFLSLSLSLFLSLSLSLYLSFSFLSFCFGAPVPFRTVRLRYKSDGAEPIRPRGRLPSFTGFFYWGVLQWVAVGFYGAVTGFCHVPYGLARVFFHC